MRPGHWHPLQEGTIATKKSMKSQGRNFIVCYPFPVKSKSPRSNFIIFFLNLKNQRWWIQMIKSSAWLSIFKQWDFMVFISKSYKKLLEDLFKCVQWLSCGFESGLNPGFSKKLLKSEFDLFMQDLCMYALKAKCCYLEFRRFIM